MLELMRFTDWIDHQQTCQVHMRLADAITQICHIPVHAHVHLELGMHRFHSSVREHVVAAQAFHDQH